MNACIIEVHHLADRIQPLPPSTAKTFRDLGATSYGSEGGFRVPPSAPHDCRRRDPAGPRTDGPSRRDKGSQQVHSPGQSAIQIAKSTSLPSGSARVHHPGAFLSLITRPPAATAAAMGPSIWSGGR